MLAWRKEDDASKGHKQRLADAKRNKTSALGRVLQAIALTKTKLNVQ